jgi:phosphatidylserine/phosphatidylglycerophosphate/cardiolipin synthase-like enzyme
MRQRSPDGAVTVRAIAGTYVVLLGINVDPSLIEGLLGFAIERIDHTAGERGYLANALLFEANDIGRAPDHSTALNPVQAFVWGDYTAKPRHTYTYRVVAMDGAPTALHSGPGTAVRISTEDADDGTHAIYFNRSVVASRAYQERFGAVAPSAVPNRQAYIWLSRGLEEALLAFIGQADDGRYALRAAFYQFQYEPVLAALKVAADAGADVSVVVHDVAKTGDATRARNRAAVDATGIAPFCTRRTHTTLAHNKFVVLLRDGDPMEVWTGSTNVTEGGIFGHVNVGHRVRDPKVAERYLEYWKQLRGDPSRDVLKAFDDPTPPFPDGRPDGPTPSTVFSPRSRLDALDWYRRLADGASPNGAVFVTAAFGLTRELEPVFTGPREYLRYLLLDLETGTVEALRRDPSNVVAAGGFKAKGGWRKWIASGLTNLNGNVDYVHTKFMLVDPTTDDPVVVTGSANWSDASIKRNDENMMVIRGDRRVADIYLTEFMRLFNHYRLRGKARSGVTQLEPGPGASPSERRKLHLRDDDSWAKPFFVAGSPEAKERVLFA